ncbi:MAG: HD domain-containing phosphohydrolase [Chthoniobacteraceae bacterium]
MTTAQTASETAAPASVLIVDDEELILFAVKELLSAEGYHASTAMNAEEALLRLREQKFALVLTDQRMPGMSGLEFLQKAKQIQPDVTRVLMTGALDLATVIDAINQGEIYRFIVKPWIKEELLATVKNAVQRYELIEQNTRLQQTTQAMNRELASLNQSLAQKVTREAQQNRQLAEMNQSLEQNLQRSVELCLKTMATFYPSLGVQAKRVLELCQSMAEGLQLPANQRQILEISALLHDVGLVGVPRRLIRLWQKNPEVLSSAELALVQQHPVMGQQLASFIHNLSEVGDIIRAHHERFDGTGYPDRLAGENIPWLARLLSVAATYAGFDGSDADALEIIRREKGKAFDPEAVRVLLRYLRPTAPRKEREVPMSELRAGMVLAKAIYTANGLLLIPEGQVLNEPYLDKLRNHNRVNPIKQSLLVFC